MTDILVPQVFKQLQLAICALGQNWCAEGLHDFLDSNGLTGKLVLGRAD
jgi:hypothetical protein